MNPDSSVSDNADSIYPCGKCHTPVTFGHKGLQCDTCSHWFHAPCQRVGDHQYDYLAESSCSWHCTRCNSQNYSTKSTQNLSSFDTSNKYSLLDTSTNFEPSVTSTPSKPNQQGKVNKKTNGHLKIANINFQSIRGKKPQFQAFLDSHKPGIVVGTETWLTPDIHDNELFPPEIGYTIFRRDRTSHKGGGVIILFKVSKGAKIKNLYNQVPHLTHDTNGKVTDSQQTPQTRTKRSALSKQVTTKHKSTLQSQAKPEYNTDSEILWTQLNLIGSKSVLKGAYYKPHELDQTSFAELEKSLNLPNLALGRLQLTKNRLATPDTDS